MSSPLFSCKFDSFSKHLKKGNAAFVFGDRLKKPTRVPSASASIFYSR